MVGWLSARYQSAHLTLCIIIYEQPSCTINAKRYKIQKYTVTLQSAEWSHFECMASVWDFALSHSVYLSLSALLCRPPFVYVFLFIFSFAFFECLAYVWDFAVSHWAGLVAFSLLCSALQTSICTLCWQCFMHIVRWASSNINTLYIINNVLFLPSGLKYRIVCMCCVQGSQFKALFSQLQFLCNADVKHQNVVHVFCIKTMQSHCL